MTLYNCVILSAYDCIVLPVIISDLSIRVSTSEVYSLIFYLIIVKLTKYYVTVTYDGHDSIRL